MSTAAHGSERDCGHTGNFFNLTWAMPGVSRGGPHATGAWMEEFGSMVFRPRPQLGLEFPTPGTTEGTQRLLQRLGRDRHVSDRLCHAPQGDPAHRQKAIRPSRRWMRRPPGGRHRRSRFQPPRTRPTCLRSTSPRHVDRAAHQLVADRPRAGQHRPCPAQGRADRAHSSRCSTLLRSTPASGPVRPSPGLEVAPRPRFRSCAKC